MKNKLLIILLTISINSFAQTMTIINFEGDKIEVTISDSKKTNELISEFKGTRIESLRKKWTARTYKLSNNKILIEFYDGQSALINNEDEFKKLGKIQFLKNNLYSFKKNISYKIEIPFDEGRKLSSSNKASKLSKFKSDSPQHYNFEVYKLNTNQILFIDISSNSKSATIYNDIKTLSSENNNIEEIEFGYDDDEYYMKELAKGNSLDDFEPNEHLIYPKYIEKIIQNHDLTLKETKVFVNRFWGNLYESKKGYWILIDEINQPTASGEIMEILTLRLYENLEQFRKAQTNYEKFKDSEVTSEHFYQKISDKYGKNFPNFIDSLISELPQILNFDKEKLSLDENGILIIDEAIKWNHNNTKLFDSWFPSVLAYYGEYFIKNHNFGKWESKLDSKYNIWIPQITLDDKTSAFNMRDFYKDLYEYPISIKWAGDFDGIKREIRRKMKKSH